MRIQSFLQVSIQVVHWAMHVLASRATMLHETAVGLPSWTSAPASEVVHAHAALWEYHFEDMRKSF